jgi:hypothetical protein
MQHTMCGQHQNIPGSAAAGTACMGVVMQAAAAPAAAAAAAARAAAATCTLLLLVWVWSAA